MALVPCRECGKSVAQSASKCPHCGVDYPTSKTAAAGKQIQAAGCALMLLAIPLLLLLAFC